MREKVNWIEKFSMALDDNLEETIERMEKIQDYSYAKLQKVRKERSYGFIQENNSVDETEEKLLEDLTFSMDNREIISKFYTDRQKFSKVLEKEGIKPIAILPKSMWTAFCRRFNLYNFNHIDHQGSVKARIRLNHSHNYLGHRVHNKLTMAIIIIVFLIHILVMAGLIISGSTSPYILGITLTIISALSFIHFTGTKQGSTALIKLEDKLEAWKYTRMNRSQLFKELWPDKTDSWQGVKTTAYNKDFLYDVKIKFPNAPKNIMETIRLIRSVKTNIKAEKYDIHVSAQEEAFVVDMNDLNLVLKYSKIKEQEAAKKADPIIYIQSKGSKIYTDDSDTTDDSIVAILGQYGNFSLEKQAIEWTRHNNFFQLKLTQN